MIIINYDFISGNELSYVEGLEAKDNFETNCLDFFSFDNLKYDVKVLKKDGSYILMSELLDNDGSYTLKQIRIAHNLQKLLKGGTFNFKQTTISTVTK